MKKANEKLLFSPSDLVNYSISPFASWMDRYYLEFPDKVTPDEDAEDLKLIASIGIEHEAKVLREFNKAGEDLIEITTTGSDRFDETLAALKKKPQIIFQAALRYENFAGFADFLILDENGNYVVWDTKLARSPKPYYAIQLCCYSEMLAAFANQPLPEKFGIILGTDERVEFRVEDFIHYYKNIKSRFLDVQDTFTGNIDNRPEPGARANHGRWTSHAEEFFTSTDHLIQVAGISSGQIKKLNTAGIGTLAQLASSSGLSVSKLANETYEKLAAQARLQNETRKRRSAQPEAKPSVEILSTVGLNGEHVGLATMPPPNPADVFFDMEGYPLMPGGLEYLFGACINSDAGGYEFKDWWAHDRAEEKDAFEGFVDWTFGRWKKNPALHLYHYAAYEVSAMRRLSTFHDTRQEEVDQMLRNDLFVDLYKVVRKGIRVGEDSYSLKSLEGLYRGKRDTAVSTGTDSIVQYAHWIESGQSSNWQESEILKDIRDYNEDDCESTGKFVTWVRQTMEENGIDASVPVELTAEEIEPKELPDDAKARFEIAQKLRDTGNPISMTLADLIDYHRREAKPLWWQMFDRADSTTQELWEDPSCIAGVVAVGDPVPEKRSLAQEYEFDAAQECKLKASGRAQVMFDFDIKPSLNLLELDSREGRLKLKATQTTLNKFESHAFPKSGSLIPQEYIPPGEIPGALAAVASAGLSDTKPNSSLALLDRTSPIRDQNQHSTATVDEALEVISNLNGGCLVIQGPPGTGKTYTASRVIVELVASGKKIGVTSNSRKAILNLLGACREASIEKKRPTFGIAVGGEADDPFYELNPEFRYVSSGGDAFGEFGGGIVGGTAWVFARPEWEGELDYLFIDEAGQVPLANAVAISRSGENLVLLGDQMQLEQPTKGSHPGDSGLSVLQYSLKDEESSREDSPVFHAVVPEDYGLFLGTSYRMHPSICEFVSESVYEGRLASAPHCAEKRIEAGDSGLITKEHGVLFFPVEHDGNTQKSEEEVAQILEIFEALTGRILHVGDGSTRSLTLEDFLFVSPYNAQVRTLENALPDGAKVGSVDKFQGQEAPVCIISLCSSYGEYGSRGLSFILNKNRVNVAISRAECLAIVVGDPRIASDKANSIEEMKLLNLYCKIVGN